MHVVGSERARTLAGRFRDATVVIVGDLMLDHFVVGRVDRISPEAPVPVVEFDHETWRLGGAANVASNARALGAKVELAGVVGNDAAAESVRQMLADHGIGASGVITLAERPTTRKMRVVTTRNQQVARVDYEADDDVDEPTAHRLTDAIIERLRPGAVLIVSDYLKGVVTPALMSRLVSAAAPSAVPVLVDPKIPHLASYKGATMVTPNHHEAETATAMRIRSDGEAAAAARRIRTQAGCRSVLITRGERGMWLLEGDESGAGVVREVALPSVAREVADVTGAGDTVIAAIGVAVGAGAGLAEAADLANFAAGVAVGKFGPATVSVVELLDAVAAHE